MKKGRRLHVVEIIGYAMAVAWPQISEARVTERPSVDATREKAREAWQANMERWIGMDINDAIRQLGIPRSQYQMPNSDMVYRFDMSQPVLPCVIDFEAGKDSKIVHVTLIGCLI